MISLRVTGWKKAHPSLEENGVTASHADPSGHEPPGRDVEREHGRIRDVEALDLARKVEACDCVAGRAGPASTLRRVRSWRKLPCERLTKGRGLTQSRHGV